MSLCGFDCGLLFGNSSESLSSVAFGSDQFLLCCSEFCLCCIKSCLGGFLCTVGVCDELIEKRTVLVGCEGLAVDKRMGNISIIIFDILTGNLKGRTGVYSPRFKSFSSMVHPVTSHCGVRVDEGEVVTDLTERKEIVSRPISNGRFGITEDIYKNPLHCFNWQVLNVLLCNF